MLLLLFFFFFFFFFFLIMVETKTNKEQKPERKRTRNRKRKQPSTAQRATTAVCQREEDSQLGHGVQGFVDISCQAVLNRSHMGANALGAHHVLNRCRGSKHKAMLSHKPKINTSKTCPRPMPKHECTPSPEKEKCK